MNAQLRTAIDRHELARNEIVQLTATAKEEDRDLTADELTRAQELAATCERDAPLIEHLTKQEARLRASLDAAAQVDAGNRGDLDVQVPPLLPQGEQLRAMHAAVQGDVPRRWTVEAPRMGGNLAGDEHQRAAVTTVQTGVGTVAMTGGVLREPRRIAVAARLPVERVDGITGTVYPVFAAGSATVVAEGLLKAEYDAVTSATAVPQMISVWSDVSRQSMLSMPAFEQRLRAKQAALVAKAEDALLVARIVAAPTQTMTAGAAGLAFSDTMLRAAALVLASDVAAAPDMALISPLDVHKYFPAATSSGATGEAPLDQLRLSMHGMQLYVTSAVTAGTAIVGAFGAGARLVLGLAPTVLIDPVSQLKKNLVTILTEMAVTLAVDEPQAFVRISNLNL